MKRISNRRTFLRHLSLGAAALSFRCSFATLKEPRRKPNIIYIMADDLGYGDLGCFGQRIIQTPHLDRLAKEGMILTQHYSGATVCAPSRCSLMTGFHGGNAYIRGNGEVKPEGQNPMPEGTVTVASLMRAAGYTTGMLGKWGLGAPGSAGDPMNQGFDFFFGYNCQREAHRYFPDHLWRNRDRVELPENADGGQKTYAQDLIADETIQFIERNQDKPFFLYLPYTIPHAELWAPEAYMAMYRGQIEPGKPVGQPRPYRLSGYNYQPEPHVAFAAMVSKLDADVGRVMETLQKLGLDRDTLVIFTSDNGPHKEGGADPDFFDSNGPLRGYKRDLYEGGIRVPTIARWPGQIKAGSRSDHISAFWDFLPTCAEVAGMDAPASDGISYLPALLGKEQKAHAALYWEFHEQGGKQAVRMGPWKGIRLGCKANPEAPLELYHLDKDIGETTNIAADHPDIVRKMERIMAQRSESPFPQWNFVKKDTA